MRELLMKRWGGGWGGWLVGDDDYAIVDSDASKTGQRRLEYTTEYANPRVT